jgi:hypothetical protein
MTRTERHRRSRRTLGIGLAISAAAHVAAIAFLAMPISTPAARSTVAIIPIPAEEAEPVAIIRVIPPQVVAQ